MVVGGEEALVDEAQGQAERPGEEELSRHSGRWRHWGRDSEWDSRRDDGRKRSAGVAEECRPVVDTARRAEAGPATVCLEYLNEEFGSHDAVR